MFKIIFLIIILNSVFVYSVIDVPSNVVVSGCGDGICNVNESCSNCKIDCGECFLPGGSGGGGSGGGSGDGTKLPNEEITENKPTDNIAKCYEYWICDDWNVCDNNEQKRDCYDFEKCNTTLYKPDEKRMCEQEAILKPPEVEEKNFSFWLFFIFILIILLLIVYLLTRKKKKRRKK